MGKLYGCNSGKLLCSLPHLQHVRSVANTCIWHLFIEHATADLKEKLLINTEQPKPRMLIKGPVSKGTIIPYAGDVVLAPPKSSGLHIGTVLGIDLFLHGSTYQSLSSECMVPAWAAKVCREPNCEYHFDPVPIKELHASASDDDWFSCPCLKLTVDVATDECVELRRGPLPDIMSTGSVDFASLLGSTANNRKANGDSSSDGSRKRAMPSFECYKPYKHLLK